MDSLKDKLMREARDGGICLQGYETMRERDINGLIAYYIQNPDWCMERNFPDLHTLETDFADLAPKGIYVGKTFHGEVLNDLQAYIFHNCKGVIKTRINLVECTIPMFYFGNNCDLTIECMEDIQIPLYVFGKNKIKTSGNATFKVYKNKVFSKQDAPRR